MYVCVWTSSQLFHVHVINIISLSALIIMDIYIQLRWREPWAYLTPETRWQLAEKSSLKKNDKQILESKDVYTEALRHWGRQLSLDIQPGVCRSYSMFLRNMAAEFLADSILDQLLWLFEQATQTERDNGGTCEAIRPDWLVGLRPYRSQSMEHPFKYSKQTARCAAAEKWQKKGHLARAETRVHVGKRRSKI